MALLEAELDTVMRLCGASSVAMLGPDLPLSAGLPGWPASG
jgi:isopentenyl diphosphate isomerase/L-lactate dehydrogenase-like FMN-dependent dehydrogenase